MTFFRLHCLHLIVLACAALAAWVFPALPDQLLWDLMPSDRAAMTVGLPGSPRYRLAMFICGTVAIVFFIPLLGKLGLRGAADAA
ncbi:hypothetical protein LP419_33455 [Massilia sp. H-1]|nr:hypothetical protein LP419_33455 [Massilia sp. H-1]